ncbi:MAG TPA: energy transducer TonB, partial [Blastocatellia bacterium]
GNTALSLAARRGRSNTYNLIEKAGATESPGGGPSELDFSSGVVSARPMMLNRPRPAYTEKARDEKFNGIARVRVLVGTDGRVKDAKIIQGLPHGLNEQAIRTAFQALFKPAMKQGHPVEYWAMLDVEFNIR